MNPRPVVKIALFFAVAVAVVAVVAGFGFLHEEDFDNRIRLSLVDHNGQRVTQNDLSGQHLLVFFGFTHCGGVCPTSMMKLTQVVNKLDQAGYTDRLIPVFISVDGRRDSVDVVRQYLTAFHERFVGLTGPQEALDATSQSFGSLSASSSVDSSRDEIVHASVVYIVDPGSRLVGYVPVDASIDTATEQIKELLL